MTSRDPGKLTDHVSLGTLTRIIPRYIVDDVLVETNSREQRSRTLPAHVVVYFVVALSLFTDGYEEVIRKLVNGLRFARVWSRDWAVPTTAALSQARTRLGEAPLKALYQAVAVPLATPTTPGAWLRDWRVMAIDGVMIDMPDTEANRAAYGNTDADRTVRPFPQIRAVGLDEVGTHAVVAVALGSIYQGERELTKTLAHHLGPDMLLTADRGFYSFALYRDLTATGCQLLWRVSSTVILPVLKVLPDGSYLSEIAAPGVRGTKKTRIDAATVDDIALATHITVRVIEYQVRDHTDTHAPSQTFRLITTILDPELASAVELAEAYHQRWEEESAFREIETYLRAGKGLRSKKPELVRQEIYGLFLAHYAIRAFMLEAADTVDIDPDRISFTRTLNIARRRITDPAAFSPLPTQDTP
ncbi:MAG TPA: IS4 family transposase [Nakamurella sp.]|nr:IS4 family transposase [Nakamurella sp.]